MRALVTGATGKVGGEAASILKSFGVAPRVLARTNEKADRLRQQGYDAVMGSFEDEHSLSSACRDIDVALLTPPDANVASANAVVNAAKAAGVQRIVRITAQGAFPYSTSAILKAHAEGEAKLEASGLQYCHLRCNTFYQNISAFFPWIDAAAAIFACNGETPVSWIDSRDIGAAAAAAVMQTDSARSYNLNGPEPLTMFDIAGLISKRLGRPIECKSFAPEDFIDIASQNGWSKELAEDWALTFTDTYWGEGKGGGSDADLHALIKRNPRRMADYLKEIDFAGDANLPF